MTEANFEFAQFPQEGVNGVTVKKEGWILKAFDANNQMIATRLENDHLTQDQIKHQDGTMSTVTRELFQDSITQNDYDARGDRVRRVIQKGGDVSITTFNV